MFAIYAHSLVSGTDPKHSPAHLFRNHCFHHLLCSRLFFRELEKIRKNSASLHALPFESVVHTRIGDEQAATAQRSTARASTQRDTTTLPTQTKQKKHGQNKHAAIRGAPVTSIYAPYVNVSAHELAASKDVR